MPRISVIVPLLEAERHIARRVVFVPGRDLPRTAGSTSGRLRLAR